MYVKTFSWSYQASIRAKGKKVETNFINGDKIVNITCMDVSDFFEDLSGKKYHLVINIPMFVLILAH